MALYGVEISPKALKFLKTLNKKDLKRVTSALILLQDFPYPPKAIKLSNIDLYRVRVGNFRILYKVEDEKLLVLVINVGHRREIYRQI